MWTYLNRYYTSEPRRRFSDEGEARGWMSEEAARLASAIRAAAA